MEKKIVNREIVSIPKTLISGANGYFNWQYRLNLDFVPDEVVLREVQSNINLKTDYIFGLLCVQLSKDVIVAIRADNYVNAPMTTFHLEKPMDTLDFQLLEVSRTATTSWISPDIAHGSTPWTIHLTLEFIKYAHK